ncbi:hypothetical protein PHYPO_G00143580 [Pangasianodon hypophthalmus]|uniref:Uncharacterized protein n=1 Tax=Pangasianodon hypophthalmus TaxID=310915 RepID=A0A5N5KEH4_PANHP|nr:hypothetical protein PHYPO_G00143580 [Pangasianodon hypophthalmus]
MRARSEPAVAPVTFTRRCDENLMRVTEDSSVQPQHCGIKRQSFIPVHKRCRRYRNFQKLSQTSKGGL